jgi:hypothetical protein
MKFVDDFTCRYANSRNKEACLLFDNNINEIR